MGQALPFPRPLRLKPSFVRRQTIGGVALLAAAVAVASTGGVSAWGSASDLSEQSRIWEAGITAPNAMAQGRVTTRFPFGLFHRYKFDVSYTDESGVFHQHVLEFETCDEVGTSAEPEVRHLRGDADRFALSWAVHARGSRILAIGAVVVIGVVMGGIFGLLGIHSLRHLSLARRRALRSEAVVARIASVRPVMLSGRHTSSVFNFEGRTADGRSVKGNTSIKIKQQPLFADPWGHTMVVLVGPRGSDRPFALLGDFHPFELTPGQQEAVRSALQSRGGGQGPRTP
jgi:hypothetical protein